MAPRTSRSVAQRYAEAARKRRKGIHQPPLSVGGVASAPITTHVDAEDRAEPAAPIQAAPQPAASAVWRPASRAQSAARHTATAFPEQYRYVWQDVRRIALITSLILVGLILLTFVIR